jgi:DNA-binding transcriptional MerR regulator
MSARHDPPVAALPPIPAKRYFTIGEVSELCGVKPHVLRYWEQEFSQLRPMKRRGNRRYYQHHEVLLVRRIRQLLYEEGFTINGARNRLGDGSGGLARGRTAGNGTALAADPRPQVDAGSIADGMAADAAEAAALAAVAVAPSASLRQGGSQGATHPTSPTGDFPPRPAVLRAEPDAADLQHQLPFDQPSLPPDLAERLSEVRAELEAVLRLLGSRSR